MVQNVPFAGRRSDLRIRTRFSRLYGGGILTCMQDAARLDDRHRLSQFREERPVVSDLVAGGVNDYDTECYGCEIVFKFKAAVSGNEDFAVQTSDQDMVFQRLPAEVEMGDYIIFRKGFYKASSSSRTGSTEASITTRIAAGQLLYRS